MRQQSEYVLTRHYLILQCGASAKIVSGFQITNVRYADKMFGFQTYLSGFKTKHLKSGQFGNRTKKTPKSGCPDFRQSL